MIGSLVVTNVPLWCSVLVVGRLCIWEGGAYVGIFALAAELSCETIATLTNKVLKNENKQKKKIDQDLKENGSWSKIKSKTIKLLEENIKEDYEH